MVLNDWNDVLAARNAADERAEQVREIVLNPEATEDDGMLAAYHALEALRLELRVLGVTVSHAIGEALDARR